MPAPIALLPISSASAFRPCCETTKSRRRAHTIRTHASPCTHRTGIGLGIAKQLLSDGYRVIASGRSTQRLADGFGAGAVAQLKAGHLQ